MPLTLSPSLVLPLPLMWILSLLLEVMLSALLILPQRPFPTLALLVLLLVLLQLLPLLLVPLVVVVVVVVLMLLS